MSTKVDERGKKKMVGQHGSPAWEDTINMNVTGAIREGIFSNHNHIGQSKIWGQGMEGNGSRIWAEQHMYRTQISRHGNVHPMCVGGDSPFGKLCYCSQIFSATLWGRVIPFLAH